MSRYTQTFRVVLVLALAAGLGACQPKVQAPPPECAVDLDCGANRACQAGKCIALNTAKERAESQIKRAEDLQKAEKVDYQAVIAAYQAAKAEVPSTPGIDYDIALAYMKAGDFTTAESMLKALREEKPDDPNPVLSLGRIYSLRGDNQGALALYNEFLKDHPTDLEILTNIATIYRGMKKYDEALAATRKILIKDPAHPGAYNNLGLIYLAMDKTLLARMVTETGIKAQDEVKHQPDAGLYNNLGLIYFKLGYEDQAVANWRKANEIDPTLVSANMNLAHKALQFADFERAKKHYLAALAQEPNNREARLGVAQCYASLKDHEAALAIYQKFLEEDKNDAVVWFNLGVLYFDHMKKQQEAHDAFRKFLALGYPDKDKNTQANNYLLMDVQVQPQEQKPAESAPDVSTSEMPVVKDAAPTTSEGAQEVPPTAGEAPAPAPEAVPATSEDGTQAAPATSEEAPAPAPTSEPAPAAAEPVPAPTPEAAPVAEPVPAPTPEVAPVTESAPAPTPEPAVEPVPAPASEAAPVAEPAPAPAAVEPVAEPVPAPAPAAPAAEPVPAPVSDAAPATETAAPTASELPADAPAVEQ